jgi:hypothetical protein
VLSATSLVTTLRVAVANLGRSAPIDGPPALVLVVVAPIHLVDVAVVKSVPRVVLDGGGRILDVDGVVSVDLGVAGATGASSCYRNEGA